MVRKLVTLIGVISLTAFAVAGVVPEEKQEKSSAQVEKDKPKPNIVKDYVCLRDGELCHPDFAKNRGKFVSCSNAVAWEQTCPPCTYHPIQCPTKTLWFDGEKCDWASPTLASQPCLDHFPTPNRESVNSAEMNPSSPGALSEQETLLQSLQSGSLKELEKAQSQWANSNPMSVPANMYFKSPKASNAAMDSEPSQELEEEAKIELKSSEPAPAPEEQQVEGESQVRKSTDSEANEPEFPSYLSPDDGTMGSKVVRLNEPVYALVSSPDGTGKQVLMRVMQPFVLEDAARGLLPNMNFINPYSAKQ